MQSKCANLRGSCEKQVLFRKVQKYTACFEKCSIARALRVKHILSVIINSTASKILSSHEKSAKDLFRTKSVLIDLRAMLLLLLFCYSYIQSPTQLTKLYYFSWWMHEVGGYSIRNNGTEFLRPASLQVIDNKILFTLLKVMLTIVLTLHTVGIINNIYNYCTTCFSKSNCAGYEYLLFVVNCTVV